MKISLIAITILAPVVLCAQKDGFSIQGKIGKIGAPAKAYLSYRESSRQVLDSAAIKNGVFEFKGVVSEPVRASIMINYEGSGTKGKEVQQVPIYLEPAKIRISSEDSLSKSKISGSRLNEDKDALTMALTPSTEKMDAFMAEYRALPRDKKNDPDVRSEMEKKRKAIEDEQQAAYTNFIKLHSGSVVSLDALKKFGGSMPDYTVVAPMFELFSKQLKNTTAGKEYAEGLAKMKATAIGAIAPDFTQNDTLGNPVKMSSFRGKYLLVDFWASWCGPCRAENPNVVKSYAKYHEKGFEILGVSLDDEKDRDKWLKAINKDGLTWPQVSDLKIWGNEVAQLYMIRAIPQNVLIDPAGKIIAKNLRGEALHNKLAEIFAN